MQTKELSAIYRHKNFEYRIKEDDIANPDDFIPHGEFNPHNIHTFILLDACYVVAVVFASNLQDALDEAVDRDKLDRFQVTQNELIQYETGKDSEGNPEYEGIAFLGNASEPFAIDGLDVIEVSSSEWTREYWTLEQLQQQLYDASDRLGLKFEPIGECGLTENALERELAKVKACLIEIHNRRA